MKQKTIEWGTEKISVLFGQVFFPTLLGMLGVSAVTTIDGIFIGHGVGSDGIAAVNICVPLLMVLTGFGLMVGMGSSITASLCLSRGRARMARVNVTQALLFVTAVALPLVGAVMLFPEGTAYWLGSSERLLPMVVDYLVWFAPSMLFTLWTAVAMFALRLDGAPKLAMWCSLLAAFVNVVLDWLFIFPFGWGVRGAAFATSISCLTGTCIAAGYLTFRARHLRLCRLRFGKKAFAFFGRNIGSQCRLGFSALLGEATMATLMFVGSHVFMQYLGDDGVGAFGVSCYYLPFIFMIGNAIAQSAQPIISFNAGIGKTERVHATLGASLTAALMCGTVATAAFVLFPKQLVGLFLNPGDIAARIAIEGFPYIGAGFIFFIANLAVVGYYQSIGKVLPATCFAMLRGFMFLIPSFILLPRALGAVGIWLALPLSEILTAVVIAAVFRIGRRHSMRHSAVS